MTDASNSSTSLKDQIVAELIAHTCFTCRWFYILPHAKPANKSCNYPGTLRVEGIRCLSWALQPDPAKRVKAIC